MAALSCALLACSEPGVGSDDVTDAGGAGAGAGGGVGGNRSGGGGPDAPAATDAFQFGGGGRSGSDAAATAPQADAACATQTARAQRLPIDLYLMLDSSLSMSRLTASKQSKWDAVRGALGTFFADPQSAGVGVGLQFFPLVRPNTQDICLQDAECGTFGPCSSRACNRKDGQVVACNKEPDCGAGEACVLLGVCSQMTSRFCFNVGSPCEGGAGQCAPYGGYCEGRDICEASAYAKPAVEVATLPGAATALGTALAAKKPDGQTPTAPALSGAIAHARSLAIANPGRRIAILLATDGLPHNCPPTDIGSVAAIVEAGVKGTPSIATFVVGVFAPAEGAQATANLGALAQAGGTGKAFVINTDQNVSQEFLAALNLIRSTALPCEYTIPPPAMGSLDFDKVNVQFTDGAGQAALIGNVRNQGACSPTSGGWYYDVDPATGGKPSQVVACPVTCGKLKADAMGRVDVVLGCKTLVID